MKANIILILIALSVNLQAQIHWVKYTNNPVFTKGPAFYDVVAVGQPTVLLENDTLKMWYAAVGGDFKSRIGYAYSTDGINWTKHSDMVINTGYQGEWDSKWLDTPEIIKVDSGYLLYYYGDSIGYNTDLTHSEAVTHSAIGVAYSKDGINWIKYANNPVFYRGNYGDWDGTWIESPAILENALTGKLMMWYNGIDTVTWKIQIGLATSDDGINWIRNTENPVLSNGPIGTYDDVWLGTPAVIYKTDHYEMWYASAGSRDFNPNTFVFDTLRICFATSDDGINWTKYENNPLFNTGTLPYDALIDEGGPWAPDVIFDTGSDIYKMWFETKSGFLFATAPDTYKNSNNKKPGLITNDINIYPNPITDYFVIDFTNFPKSTWDISLYNIRGQAILRSKDISVSKYFIKTKELPNGEFLLNLKNKNEEIFTKKLIK